MKAFLARLGAMYGAALGLVVGMIVLACVSWDPIVETRAWGYFVAGGAVVGVITGLILARVYARPRDDRGDD